MLEFIQGRNDIVVKLDGKWVGCIERAPFGDGQGWRYRPKDSKIVGDTFPTLRECKKSLV